MASVEQMIDTLIGKEGRFVDNPNDKGGPTKWGVTIATARRCGYLGQMAAMPREIAADIYRREYFILPGFDQIYPLSQRIAEELFDTGVNMGVSVPGPWLQTILNALNRNGSDYQDITVDGRIGAQTVAALRALLNRRGAEGETVVVRALNCLQGARYLDITAARPANENFIYGWLLNRVAA